MSHESDTYVMVDIEADGPIPGDYSMISIGAVIVRGNLDVTFRADLRPISDRYVEKSLEVCGVSREETLLYDDPKTVMERFNEWLVENAGGNPRFISDNNGFDWMFVCWYFHHFLGINPFGYSSDNLGSLYRGQVEDMSGSFKYLRKTQHNHDPLDDAVGNAEALQKIWLEMKPADEKHFEQSNSDSDASDHH